MESSTQRNEIGPWGLIKAQIIDEYLHAYIQIMRNQPWCRGTLYVDAFAGAPESVVRGTDIRIPGSAKRALALIPGFDEYHFIDLDPKRASELIGLVADDDRAKVYQGDGNEIISQTILPTLAYENYRRGVILLDPFGLDLEWNVVQAAGQTKSTDVIINFPTMDINRNALHRDASTIDLGNSTRMTRWWGDESWRDTFYRQHPQIHMWDDQATVKIVNNDDVVAAYCERLRLLGGFEQVTRPYPVKNSKCATLYYLILASQKSPAVKIMNDIGRKYARENQCL